MFRVIIDLFVAGSDTTANTMTWCILFMQEHPDIQKKCKQVMQEVNVEVSDFHKKGVC